MTESTIRFAEQVQDIPPQVPHYEYEGLSLPPGIVLDAFFGAHSDIGDIREVQTMLKAHDVVITENFGSDASNDKILQKIANGDFKARERMSASIQATEGSVSNKEDQLLSIRSLYDIKRPLLFIDPTDKNPLVGKITAHFRQGDGFGPNLDENIAREKTSMTEHAQNTLARENYMLRSFCEQVSEAIKSNPKLSRKYAETGHISVVMFNFGLTHSGLYAGIQEVARRSGVELGGDLTIVNSYGNVFVDFSSQASGRAVYGQEVDDLLAAKRVVSSVLALSLMKKHSLSRYDANAQAVTTVYGMTLDELHDLFGELTHAA